MMTSRRIFLRSMLASALLPGALVNVCVAAEARSGKSLRIAFVTDLHSRAERNAPEALRAAAKAVNAAKADIIIGGGDYITEGFESKSQEMQPRWQLVRHFLESLEQPLIPAIGNHDLIAAKPADESVPSTHPKDEFLNFFQLERSYRSIDIAGTRFIFLDPIALKDDALLYHGEICGEQLRWLKDQLRQLSPRTPIVVVTHIPLLTAFFEATEGATKGAPANRVITNGAEVISLFADHNLRLVLQGHLHVNEMLRWKNTTFITGGAICGRWWQGEWHGTREGFGLVTLSEDKIDWEYRDYGWHQGNLG